MTRYRITRRSIARFLGLTDQIQGNRVISPSCPEKALDAGDIKHAAFDYYRRLRRVKRYIDRHYAEDVTLSNAASIACLEEKYFSHFFHKKTGVRFVDFLSYVRVEHAKRLLGRNDLSVSEVAETVGYHNRRALERAFKKWTGSTPTRFRMGARPN